MKKYSFLQLIFIAFLVSFITAFLISAVPFGFAGSDDSFSFLKNLPFFNLFLKDETSQNSNLKSDNVRIPVKEAGPYSAGGYEAQVISAVKKVSPAVVSITITKNVPIIERFFVSPFGDDEFFRQFFGPDFNIQIPQLRQKGFEKKDVGGGTGFIISPNGLILTNKHVVADAEAEYTVFTNDGKKYPAQVLARDPAQDLAVIKIDAPSLPSVTLGDSDNLQIGQTAISIGNALGEFRNTVSVGVVSGLARSVTASGAGITENIQGVIQTDAAINPGNSGGPLINLKGEVIGINTAIVSGAQNIGFAIPINKAKRDIKDVISKGKIIAPLFGVRFIVVNQALKEKKSLPFDYGALVASGPGGEPAVLNGSPADRAGIKEGDVILEFGGQKVDQNRNLSDLVNSRSVGDVVLVKIWRQGQILTFSVTLAERPAQ